MDLLPGLKFSLFCLRHHPREVHSLVEPDWQVRQCWTEHKKPYSRYLALCSVSATSMATLLWAMDVLSFALLSVKASCSSTCHDSLPVWLQRQRCTPNLLPLGGDHRYLSLHVRKQRRQLCGCLCGLQLQLLTPQLLELYPNISRLGRDCAAILNESSRVTLEERQRATSLTRLHLRALNVGSGGSSNVWHLSGAAFSTTTCLCSSSNVHLSSRRLIGARTDSSTAHALHALRHSGTHASTH